MTRMKKILASSMMITLLCVTILASFITPQTKAALQGGDAYALYVTSSLTIGNGIVNNPVYITGSGPDGYYAQIYGGNIGDGGAIICEMSSTVPAGSYIAIYQYSASGYYSSEIVDVSNSSAGPWTEIGSATISGGPAWTYFTCPVAFTYIAIVGYDNGIPVNLYIDCVVAV
jgi:hypothetical protein